MVKNVLQHRVITTSCLVFAVIGCGGGSDSSPPAPTPPVASPTAQAPQNVQVVAQDREITISWDESSTGETYDVYLASDLDLQFENYASFSDAVWLQDVSSPVIYTPTNLYPLYRVIVVARLGGDEVPHSEVTTVAPRYTDRNETVFDHQTNLTWMKCAIGQTFDESENTCVGEPSRLSNDEALNYINANEPEFRLPTESELITLVHCDSGVPEFFLTDIEARCEETTGDSSIYSVMFPGIIRTEISGYRTSTLYSTEFGTTTYTRVSFGPNGGRSNVQASEPAPVYVRLVKR